MSVRIKVTTMVNDWLVEDPPAGEPTPQRELVVMNFESASDLPDTFINSVAAQMFELMQSHTGEQPADDDNVISATFTVRIEYP